MADHSIALVLSGGVALGSYQAGVFEELHARDGLRLGWIAGSSVGAINGALMAGTPPERRVETLREYWLRGSPQGEPLIRTGIARHTFNWLSVAQARLFGSPRHLHIGGRSSFYDLTPTVDFLNKAVDFDRLNGGEVRYTVAAVDVETGNPVVFDTAAGERIGIDHLLASCGFLPEFAPVEIGGRLLGDGGLAMNAPIEPVLDALEGKGGVVFVVDLFARDGTRPRGLQEALERKNALLFGNQTFARLELYRRFWARHGVPAPTVLYLSYRQAKEEAGPEAPFDFSRASAEDRWREGILDAGEAIARLETALASATTLTTVRRAPELL